MKLNEIISKVREYVGNEVEIDQIYHGLDHHCRCGCGGNYFKKGDKGFTRAINTMSSNLFFCYDDEVRICQSGETIWANIPYYHRTDKCYCIYFKKIPSVAKN